MMALSIRQPWAWLIAHGYKDIENRMWPTRFRGKFLIHAGKGMSRGEYICCLMFIAEMERPPIEGMPLGLRIPPYERLREECGGIVGEAEVTGCVESSASQWFTGPYGFEVANPRVRAFRPWKGQLNFWDVPMTDGKAEGVVTPVQVR